MVTDVSNIAALSRVGLSVSGHSHGVQFTHIPEETVQLQTRRFALHQVDGMPFWPMLIVKCQVRVSERSIPLPSIVEARVHTQSKRYR